VRTDRRDVALLATAQTLMQSASVLAVTLGALVGGRLASERSMATVPIAAMVLGTVLAALPAAALMRRIGRRDGFLVGAAIGVSAGLVAAAGVYFASFATFVAGHGLLGIYQGFANYYRFAAGEAAAPDFRSRAMSWVIAGGVVAAIAGPQLAYWPRDLFPVHPFLGAYLAQAGLAVMALAALVGVSALRPVPSTASAPPRRTVDVARQPVFLVAMGAAATGYAVMLLVMTATPVAMVGCGYGVSDAVQVIQWHVLGMFAPSFFTGALIARYGALQVMATGFLLLIGHVAISLAGTAFLHFASGLVLLGVGWNFSFIGGTTLLTTAYRPAERERAQALNDFFVFGIVALASLSSGWLYHRFGWQAVNLAALPLLAVALVSTLALAHGRRPVAAA